MSAYRSSARAPLGTVVGLADALLPGTSPLGRQLSRRSLWGALPRRSAERPDAVNRLVVSVDCDYQSDTDALPGLVELLRRADVPMSVAAVGALVDADPGPYEQVVAAGHEIVNHSQTHPDNPVLNADEEFWHLSTGRMAEEVAQAQDVFAARLGVRPVGFRTPHFKDAHRLTGVLGADPDIRYVSSALATRAPLGGQPYLASSRPLAGEDLSHLFASADDADDTAVLQVPLSACPRHRWSPFCSYHAIRAGARPGTGAGMHGLGEWADLWQELLRSEADDGLVVTYFDPQDLMRDEHTVAAFEDMLNRAVALGWQLCTLRDVHDAYSPLPEQAAR